MAVAYRSPHASTTLGAATFRLLIVEYTCIRVEIVVRRDQESLKTFILFPVEIHVRLAARGHAPVSSTDGKGVKEKGEGASRP